MDIFWLNSVGATYAKITFPKQTNIKRQKMQFALTENIDFVSIIQNAGLNPFIGIMHKLADNHYALASDLMEEFRPFVYDSVAVRLVRRNIITTDDFIYNDDGSVYLNRNGTLKAMEAYFDAKATAEVYLKIVDRIKCK